MTTLFIKWDLNIKNLPPAKERADLSLNLRLMGPATFGAVACSTGDLTDDTIGPMDTGGWGKVALTGNLPEDTAESLCGSGEPNCLDKCKWCIMACNLSLSFCSCSSNWDTTCICTRAWAVDLSSNVCSVFKCLQVEMWPSQMRRQGMKVCFLKG